MSGVLVGVGPVGPEETRDTERCGSAGFPCPFCFQCRAGEIVSVGDTRYPPRHPFALEPEPARRGLGDLATPRGH
jgi:hypothetical protein